MLELIQNADDNAYPDGVAPELSLKVWLSMVACPTSMQPHTCRAVNGTNPDMHAAVVGPSQACVSYDGQSSILRSQVIMVRSVTVDVS